MAESNFCWDQVGLESWVSGWNQQFAKLSYGLYCTGGSNPPLSAQTKAPKSLHLGAFLLVNFKQLMLGELSRHSLKNKLEVYFEEFKNALA